MSYTGPGSEHPVERPPPIEERPLSSGLNELASPGEVPFGQGGRPSRTVLYFALAVAAGIVIVLGGFVTLRPTDDSTDPGDAQPPIAPETSAPPTSGSSDGSTEASDGETTEPTTSQPEPPPPEPIPQRLQPLATSASSERSPVARLNCGGSNSFESDLLVDGDLNTGWGAGSGNGVGEWIQIQFDSEVRIVEVAMTPGYLREAPRQDQDCQTVSAFRFNRFIEEVTYVFDDGSTVSQTFTNEPTLQSMAIEEKVTQSVWIRIESTVATVDNDTIISEAEFYGFTQ